MSDEPVTVELDTYAFTFYPLSRGIIVTRDGIPMDAGLVDDDPMTRDRLERWAKEWTMGRWWGLARYRRAQMDHHNAWKKQRRASKKATDPRPGGS